MGNSWSSFDTDPIYEPHPEERRKKTNRAKTIRKLSRRNNFTSIEPIDPTTTTEESSTTSTSNCNTPLTIHDVDDMILDNTPLPIIQKKTPCRKRKTVRFRPL